MALLHALGNVRFLLLCAVVVLDYQASILQAGLPVSPGSALDRFFDGCTGVLRPTSSDGAWIELAS